MARVAALIVAYYSAAEVAELAANLADPEVSGSNVINTYVIDNSGDPDEIAVLRSIPNIAGFVASENNLGYGAGMNALAKQLVDDYDWLLVCNPDIRFAPDGVARLVSRAQEHANAALFGPQITGDDGLVYPSARAFPSIRTGVGHALFSNIWPDNPWTSRYHRSQHLGEQDDSEVDWLSGACILVRPTPFRDVGGFDESYFMYFEDVDLSWRLHKREWRAVYVPTAHIVHSGAHSTSRQASFMRKVHHQSAQRYLSRKYSGWYLAPVRLVLRLGLFVRRELLRR